MACVSDETAACPHSQATRPDALRTPQLRAQLRALEEGRRLHSSRAEGLASLREVLDMAREMQAELLQEEGMEGEMEEEEEGEEGEEGEWQEGEEWDEGEGQLEAQQGRGREGREEEQEQAEGRAGR